MTEIAMRLLAEFQLFVVGLSIASILAVLKWVVKVGE